MDRETDLKIRTAMMHLVDASPTPPPFSALLNRRYRSPRKAVLGAVGVLIAGPVALALVLLLAPGAPLESQSAAGLVIVHINSRAAGSVEGRVPRDAVSHGRINWAAVPEYISVVGPGGTVVGYIQTRDVDGSTPIVGPLNGGTSMPVCGTDGIDVYNHAAGVVIGHLFPNAGYVPNGTTPTCVTPTTFVSPSGS